MCLVEPFRTYPEFASTRESMPILLVVADGWNHAGDKKEKLDRYNAMKAEILDTRTVGEFKKKFKDKWRPDFYHFGPKGGEACRVGQGRHDD